MLQLLIIIIFLTGCGQKYTQFHVDAELQPYVDSFLLEAKTLGTPVVLQNIVIQLGDASAYKPQVNKIGYCLSERDSGWISYFDDTESSNIVVIDRAFFTRVDVSDKQRTELIFHELGHCVLFRKHDTRLFEGFPESIMYPMSISTRNLGFYMAHESNYLKELFGVTSSALSGSSSQIIQKIELKQEKGIFISTEEECISE